MAEDWNDLSDAEWKARLDPDSYATLRNAATERAFTGKYWDTWTAGTYHCAGCDTPLFRSETKFDAGCGWPSFDRSLEPEAVAEEVDEAFGMVRRESLCATCGGHLGHVFPDGPTETGERYCMNSTALKLVPDEPTE